MVTTRIFCVQFRSLIFYANTDIGWKSKISVSPFPLVKDKLLEGMINACWLRTENILKTDAPILKLNPYTNVDMLVGRLMSKETVNYGATYI